MNDSRILESARWFWPLVLIPYSIESAHTRAFTGREVVKDVKATMSRVRVTLTGDALMVTGRLTRIVHLEIPVTEITSVNPQQRRLVRIEFRDAERSRLVKAMMSGQPGGSRHAILLNVPDRDTWAEAIRRLTT